MSINIFLLYKNLDVYFPEKNMLYNMGKYIQNFFEQRFSTCSCPLDSKTDNSILKDI